MFRHLPVKQSLPIIVLCLLFLLLKLPNVAIRASDTSIYFYTAKELLSGKLLYKDIFFTNFPLLPYVSMLYVLLLHGSLTAYFATPLFETVATAVFIFVIAKQKAKDILLASMSAGLYLFSFIVLSTTDHQTGVFLASFFAVLSYFFFGRKQFFLTGVFLALALLTKAYFLPLLFAYVVFLLIKKPKGLLTFCLGGLLTAFVVLLPSLLFARTDLIKDVFAYSLTRSQGIDKSGIFWFFFLHDTVFVVLLLFNLFTIKKNIFFGLVSIFSILFLIGFQDIYYLYLNFMIPFLCLSLPCFVVYVQDTFHPQKYLLPSLLVVFLGYTLTVYFFGYRNLQKLSSIDQIVATIKKEQPSALYGVNGITPALAYLSNAPLLNNIVDTNDNIYRKGYLNAHKLTADAIAQKAVIVTEGANYPEFAIKQDVMTEIVDTKQLEAHCMIFASFPLTSEGLANRINFFRCE